MASPRTLPAQAPLPRDFVALDSTVQLRGALAAPVTMHGPELPMSAVVAEIARQARLSFVADGALPAMSRLLRFRVTATPAATALQRALAGSGLRGFVGPANQLLIVPIAVAPRGEPPAPAPAVRLSGFVRSAASREVIRNAVLSVGELRLSRESNEEGYFVLTLQPGSHRLRVRARFCTGRHRGDTLCVNHARLHAQAAADHVRDRHSQVGPDRGAR